MRGTSTARATGRAGRGTRYSTRRVLAAALLTSAAVVGTVLTLAMPVVGVVAAAVGVGGTAAGRRLRSTLRERRQEAETRTVCVPHTGVCVEA